MITEKRTGSDSGSGSERKKTKKIRGGSIGGDLAVFGEFLKETDLARLNHEQ